MELLGVGPLELVFILIIIFLVLGPEDLEATGMKIGRFLNRVRKSELWQGFTQVTREVRSLPHTLMREANLEETRKELQKDLTEVGKVPKEFDLEGAKKLQKTPVAKENTIAPPAWTTPPDKTAEHLDPEPNPEETPKED